MYFPDWYTPLKGKRTTYIYIPNLKEFLNIEMKAVSKLGSTLAIEQEIKSDASVLNRFTVTVSFSFLNKGLTHELTQFPRGELGEMWS